MRIQLGLAVVLSLGGRASAQLTSDPHKTPMQKYSIEMAAKGVRNKIQMDDHNYNAFKGFMLGGTIGMTYNTMKTPANPDVYLVLKVKGGETFLIPERLRSIDDRTSIVNFSCPAAWEGHELIVEIWRDNGNSEAFWRAIVSAIRADVQAGVSLPVASNPVVPVTASAKAGLTIDKDTFKDVTLVRDSLLATGKLRLPAPSKKADGPMTSTFAAFGRRREIPLGTLTFENHGASPARD